MWNRKLPLCSLAPMRVRQRNPLGLQNAGVVLKAQFLDEQDPALIAVDAEPD